MPTNNIKAITLSSFDAAALTPIYQSINAPNGLPHAVLFMRIVNDSDVGVLISYDGINDNEYMSPDSSAEFPFQANSLPNNKVAQLATGTQIYVRALAAGMGVIVVSGYYC